MLFRLANTQYDHHTERGYVEFRANDGDGGEIVIATILSWLVLFLSGECSPLSLA
jgi:hypothetical protein